MRTRHKHVKKQARTTTKARPARVERGRFAPGTSGNPGGRPRDLAGFRLAARVHTQKALGVLVAIMVSKKASASARVRAVSELLDRGWGKPMMELHVAGAMANIDMPAKDFDAMNHDEKIRFGSTLAFLLADAADHGDRARAPGGWRRAAGA